MTANELINEYEAAALIGMSPDLLRWLTSHAPKQGIIRKLKIARKEKDLYFFDKEELLAFDNWLKQPWPHKDDKRPHIPTAIRQEIKIEANGECAICKGHKDTCEAAHIAPVAKSNNNHPENLIWLCSNHHTAFDDGFFGPDKENADFVISFKQVLRRYKVMQWRMQHELNHKLFVILEFCRGLSSQLESVKTKEQAKAVEDLAEKVLNDLPALGPVSKADPKYKAYQSISVGVASLSTSKSGIAVRLKKAEEVRQEYVSAYGFVVCPLCQGSGRHDGTDCPVCNGDREIEERYVDRIDLTAYAKVDCPLCKGSGKFEGEDCPACGGEAQMDRRYAEAIDNRDYEKIECPLCRGSRNYGGAPCPVCSGDGEIDRRHLPRIELGDYQDVDCPVCAGHGQREGRDCPECGGEGTLQRRHVERLDMGDYAKVDCPVCEGTGRRHGDDCPFCGGEAQIDRRVRDGIDMSAYQMVDCPRCNGSGRSDGDDCRTCDGEGEMERRFAERLD